MFKKLQNTTIYPKFKLLKTFNNHENTKIDCAIYKKTTYICSKILDTL